jgi:MFS family permease
MLERAKAVFRAWCESSLGPFSIPLFRSLWIAALASNIGAVIQSVGAAWTMTILAPSPQMVALVPAAAMLPMVILALPAGALADIMERRGLMLASQIIGACGAGLLSVLAFTHLVTPWLLLALTAVVGASVAIHQPAWQASLGDFIPRKDLPAAVSLNVIAFNTARSIGPAVGGALIATLSASAAFLLNALSFLGLIVVLATHALPRAERRHPPEPMLSAMAVGIRFVSLSPQLKRIFLRGALFGLGASALQSLLPLMARSQLGGGPIVFGTLVGSFGFGSFFGALIATHVRSNIGGNRMLGIATIVYASATLVIAISTRLLLSIPFAFVAGIAFIFVLTTTRTSVQLCCPRWVVGRAVSLGQVASFGCMALGSAGWGAIAVLVGLSDALLIAAGFLTLTTLLHRLAPLPVVVAEEAARHTAPRIPAPNLAIDNDAGPIVVVIEYRVAPNAAREFLALMHELGRARRRNGAIDWSIQQDIDRPEVWLEYIASSTWIDHIRRLDRYTAGERALADRVATFRTATDRAVRRMLAFPAGSIPIDRGVREER